MKTALKKICDLEIDNIFILDGVEYIVTGIHHFLIWYVPTATPNERAKFMAQMQLRLVEVYES